jgi:uncharacterized protein YodC (DUF2158 family)
MAASFKLADTVKVAAPAPQGTVLQLAVNQDGELQYLVEYTDGNGVQQRWFKEEDLVKV